MLEVLSIEENAYQESCCGEPAEGFILSSYTGGKLQSYCVNLVCLFIYLLILFYIYYLVFFQSTSIFVFSRVFFPFCKNNFDKVDDRDHKHRLAGLFLRNE